jgi:hypothetical protein
MIRFRALLVSALVIFLFSFQNVATASDLPVLTWERGKEQNVVLGNIGKSENLKVVLAKRNSTMLTFSKSRVNAKGFIVYTASIPSNIPLGTYFVEAVDFQGKSNSVVAAVDIIKLKDYDIGQAPSNLFLEFGFFTFIFTTLLISSRKKHFGLELLELEKSEDSEFSEGKRANFVDRIANLYAKFQGKDSKMNSEPSFLKSILRSNEKTLKSVHHLLPLLLALITCLVVAVLAFSTSKLGDPIPYWGLLSLILLGMIHFYSAVIGSFVFIVLNLIFKDIHSVRDLMFVVLQISSISLLGILGTIYYHLVRHDLFKNSYLKTHKNGAFISRIISSLISTFFFIALTILAQSLIKTELVSQHFLIFGGLVVLAISLFLNHNLFAAITSIAPNSTFKNIREIKIPNSNRAQVAQFGAFSVCVSILIYLWTTKFVLSLISMIFLTTALALVNYSKLMLLRLKLTRRLDARIGHSYTFIPGITAILASLEILFMKWLPVVTFDKVKLAVYFGFIPLVACAIIVALVDSEIGGPEV